jgi:TolA-binding protein
MTTARGFVIVAMLCAGCVTTRDEGEAMKRDIATLKGEVAEGQRASSDRKTQDETKLAALEKRVNDLETTVRQNNADSGVQMDKLVGELQNLRGDIEQTKHDVADTNNSVKDILARPPASVAREATAPKVDEDPKKIVQIGGVDIPIEAKAHYETAKKMYDEKKFQDAIDAFDLFLHRHDKDAPELMDNAAYWKAESYYNLAQSQTDQKAKEKSLKQAILAYQPVIENPKSGKQDGALFKAGLSFEQLGDKDDAAVFFDELITKYPKSSLVAEAKKHLKAVGGTKKKH